jgi:hypothetical protein
MEMLDGQEYYITKAVRGLSMILPRKEARTRIDEYEITWVIPIKREIGDKIVNNKPL